MIDPGRIETGTLEDPVHNAAQCWPDQAAPIIDKTDERLAYFKTPRYWTFRDTLPLTP